MHLYVIGDFAQNLDTSEPAHSLTYSTVGVETRQLKTPNRNLQLTDVLAYATQMYKVRLGPSSKST